MILIDCFYSCFMCFRNTRARFRKYFRIDINDAIDIDGVPVVIESATAQITHNTSESNILTASTEIDTVDISFELRWFLSNYGTDYLALLDVIAEAYDCNVWDIQQISYVRVLPNGDKLSVDINEQPPFNTLSFDN